MRSPFLSYLVFSAALTAAPATAEQAPPTSDIYYPLPATQLGVPYAGVTLPPASQYDVGVGYTDLQDDAELYDDEGAYSDPGYVDEGYDAEAYTEFQPSLAPYGQWVSVADYGTVWSPSVAVVGADFSPYATGGHWVLTEYGWTWVSDWDWGWAPFHYGRWITAGSFGWCWVPGRVWGPAWVSWRFGGGYVGWAPLAPRGVVVPPPPAGPASPWRFTTTGGMLAPKPQYLSHTMARQVFASTAPMRNVQTVNNARVEAGPAPRMVAAAVGHSLTPSPIHQLAVAAPRTTIAPRAPLAAPPSPAAAAGHLPTALAPPGPMRASPGAVAPGVAPGDHPSVGSASPPQNHAGMFATAPGPAPAYQPYRAPSYSAPSYRSPASSWPAYRAPTYSAPAYRPPTYHAPSYSSPAYRSPTLSAPAYRAPSYSPPAYHAPSYSAPAYRAPSYSAPSYRAPSYSAPSYSAPSYRAPSYSAPSYSAPSYHAPSYSAPSYHAPSYSAPSYHAPSGGYSAPHFGGGRR